MLQLIASLEKARGTETALMSSSARLGVKSRSQIGNDMIKSRVAKQRLAVAAVAALVSGSALALPVFIDVGAAGGLGSNADGNTLTKKFNSLQFYAETTSTQYLGADGIFNAGDKFSDTGNASVSNLLPPGGDTEGIGVSTEITVAWTGLTGVTSSLIAGTGLDADKLIQSTIYDSGTVFSYYYQEPNDADFGATFGSGDDTGITNGTLVLQVTVLGGVGTNKFDIASGNFITGSSNLQGKVTFALDNFISFVGPDGLVGTSDDKDFSDLLGLAIPIEISSLVDQNTNDVTQESCLVVSCASLAGAGPAGFRVLSNHDGSQEFATPEPTVLALLGLGLAGVGVSRRRSPKS